MMCAGLQELVVLSALFPSWSWKQATARRVIVASDGSVIRLYWMPALLCLDEFRSQLFVQQLNAFGSGRGIGED